MKQVEFYTWMLPPDAWRKKPSPSSYKMSRETAESRYPGATPILSTLEVRDCPETREEMKSATGAPWQGVWPTVGE